MKITQVVAAVIYNKQGEYLLSSRPEDKAYAGYWEFAGGKIEPGESAIEALQRELDEELGIEIKDAGLWLTINHQYEHAHVNLQFFRIAEEQWHGQLTAKENQSWAWQNTKQNNVAPILPANTPITKALSIPTVLSGSLLTGLVDELGECFYHPEHENILQLNWSVAAANDLPMELDGYDAWVIDGGFELDWNLLSTWLAKGVSRPVLLALPKEQAIANQHVLMNMMKSGLHGYALLD